MSKKTTRALASASAPAGGAGGAAEEAGATTEASASSEQPGTTTTDTSAVDTSSQESSQEQSGADAPGQASEPAAPPAPSEIVAPPPPSPDSSMLQAAICEQAVEEDVYPRVLTVQNHGPHAIQCRASGIFVAAGGSHPVTVISEEHAAEVFSALRATVESLGIDPDLLAIVPA